MLSPEMRQSLARKLNAMIDIPFLNEDHEQAAIEKFMEAILGPLETIDIPQSELETVSNDKEKQSGLQSSIVNKLNAMIDIPFVNEEQEAMALNLIVEYVLKDKLGQKVPEDD